MNNINVQNIIFTLKFKKMKKKIYIFVYLMEFRKSNLKKEKIERKDR